jgi:DAK2 domain fusion protein YloV
MASYRDALQAHRDQINRLNVYPVPDGDTGTNMSLTLESVVNALDDAGDDMSDCCRAIARGSLMGARGNSGVILSQILRGLSEVFREVDSAGPEELARAIRAASEAADSAVSRPVEGTILTVVRAAAEGAEEASGQGKPLVDVVEWARSTAAEALDRTPEMLPVLAEAGVVDAGGLGFLLLHDALLHVVAGRPLPAAEAHGGPSGAAISDEAAGEHSERSGEPTGEQREPGVSGLRYEVMFFLDAPDDSVPAFKEAWKEVGDSIVVAGGDGLWNCHIHTDDIGAAIEAALEAGRPRQIRVTDLKEQVEEERWVREGMSHENQSTDGPSETVPTAVVAVGTGEGLHAMFRSLGAHRVVAGGQSMNPSTAELLAAVEAAPGDAVVLLPNNKNIVPVAERVDALTDKAVRVVRTNAVAEGLAALLEYDPQVGAEDNVGAMTEAARQVSWGEVTRAVRASSSEAGPIKEGDWLGISSRGIEAIAPSVAEAATGLLSALVSDDHEMLTVIEGEGASEADTDRITTWLAEHQPGLTVEVHKGGQPLYPYLLSVE